jgi:hypothetical protein
MGGTDCPIPGIQKDMQDACGAAVEAKFAGSLTADNLGRAQQCVDSGGIGSQQISQAGFGGTACRGCRAGLRGRDSGGLAGVGWTREQAVSANPATINKPRRGVPVTQGSRGTMGQAASMTTPTSRVISTAEKMAIREGPSPRDLSMNLNIAKNFSTLFDFQSAVGDIACQLARRCNT